MKHPSKNKNPEPESKGEIVIYTAKGGETELEVRLEEETVWLNLNQMADLFDRDKSVISRHLKNVFEEKELDRHSVVAKFATTALDGKTYNVDYFNLDVIISVGYRVKSKIGTQFRIWANKVLKDHLIKGYSINQKRLLGQTEKLIELQQAISFIQDKAAQPELKGQAEELLKLVNEYSKSLTLLYQYDEGTLSLQKGKKPGVVLNYENCRGLINKLKEKLIQKREAGGLFGQEMDSKFRGIVATIYQTFDGKDLYPSIEEKAANLLYLTIKDHPFSDGNKRIGSLLFIYFLERNNSLFKESGERKITDNTLVALALLVATSNPKEKDVMIKIITNLLKG